jgi:hypothetical protein
MAGAPAPAILFSRYARFFGNVSLNGSSTWRRGSTQKTQFQNKVLVLLVAAMVAGLLPSIPSLAGHSQSPESSAISLPTSARIRKPGWWPTKGEAAGREYAGSEACAECHELKNETQERSAMAHAAAHAADSDRLRAHNHLTSHAGGFTYEMATSGGKSTLTVSDGKSTLSADLLWALGSAHMGQTFLYEQDGKFFESHLSYFAAPESLDITPGQPRTTPANLEQAAGRVLSTEETHKCFGCHTTGSSAQNSFAPDGAVPGVTCEACHGPGAKHVAAARAHTEKRGSGLIFNPAQLARVDSVDFCGACHRTWQDVVSGNLIGVGMFNVRFAPYRLENSRCWEKGDARITCLGCHDPHKPLVHDSASYDANCLACHRANRAGRKDANHPGAACPVAPKNCVRCHMPKVEPPGLHSSFTDHWIRLVKPGAPYPD